MSSEFGGELLDEHGRFLRRLAAALVRDPHRAEDVAHETWLRWFTRPPRDRSRPRQWLTTVTRGVAANLRRGDGRRAQVEGNVPPPEAHETTPLDSLRQAERIERVAAAVRALETPYREVILARHFRGLSVRELALETGTSEDTLRTRERRALEQLRAALDREFGGRDAWALALGALAPRVTGVASGIAAAAWWFGGSVAVLGAVTVVLSRSRNEPAVDPLEAVSSVFTQVVARSDASATAEREPITGLDTPPTSARSPGSSTSSVTTSAECELRARFLLESGAPASHATWNVYGREANEDRAREHGLPEAWVDPSGTTDAAGRLVVRFTPPPVFQFELYVKAPGHAWAVWSWSELAPGSVLDLGTVSLARGATVLGHVLDGGGAPILSERWSVRAKSLPMEEEDGRQGSFAWVDVDPSTGAFLLEDVQPGRVRLEADDVLGVELEPVVLQLTGAEVHTHNFVHTGLPANTRIALQVGSHRSDPRHTPALEHIRLRADDGSEYAPRAQGSRFHFEALEAGLYQLEIDDPWFRPWSQAGIAPGTAVRARLEPCSGVILVARDETGAVLEVEQVKMVRPPGSMPREKELLDRRVPFDGRLALFPGSYALRVVASGHAGDVEVHELGFDETRTLEVVLRAPAEIRGRVRALDGSPLAAHEVLLVAPAELGDSDACEILPPNASSGEAQRMRHQLARTWTDAEGRYGFTPPAGQTVLVVARQREGAGVSSQPLALAPSERLDDIDLVLPSGARVFGQVRGPAGLSLTGVRLWIKPEGARLPLFDQGLRTLSEDGTFSFDGLAPVRLSARVAWPHEQRPVDGGEASTFSFWPLELATFEAAEGQSYELELSLESELASVAVDVRADGVPLSEARVQLQRLHASGQLSGQAHASGHFGPMLLFAGEWMLTVEDPARSWRWRAPRPLRLQAGETLSTAVEITLANGVLRFLDHEGRPRANVTVHLRLDDPDEHRPFTRVSTDQEGRATLRLPSATYRFALQQNEPGAQVEWTTSGPLDGDVRL